MFSELEEYEHAGIIVHGASSMANGSLNNILSGFPKHSSVTTYEKAAGEPEIEEVSRLINFAKQNNARWIVGIGGGSVLDLAKAAAGLFNAEKDPAYYQDGGKLECKGIPFIAVPTVPGSGAEATPNAVIINRSKNVKLSIRDLRFMADKIILDPDLVTGINKDLLSYSAIDGLVQAYESYVSKNANWYTETFSLKAIELFNNNIEPAVNDGSVESISNLLLASLFTAVAFTNSRLGIIHGVAHPLGVLYNAPHGLVCASLFEPSIRLNKAAIGSKYDVMSKAVGGDFLERVNALLKALNIKSPFKGKKIISIEKIISETLASGSAAANPKKVEAKDVEMMLKCIF